MRRTTSALTTTILGAALAASAVSAQQILPSPGARRGDSAAPASDSTPAAGTDAGAGTAADPIVGMAATRGPRYLLRNGLDYINYQEYERALKYLREAETRQKELSNSERLTLKQAIERAQRGLREAVGTETPYALSQRSRRPGAFAAARPDTQIAARKTVAPAQDSEALTRMLNREGDDQGQPIRLTGAEVASPSASLAPASAAPAAVTGDAPQPLPIAAEPAAQLSGPSKLQGVAATTETIAEKLTKIADAPPEPAGGALALAAIPTAAASATVMAEAQLPAQASVAPVDTNVPAPSPSGAASLVGPATVAASAPAPGAVPAPASLPAAVEPTPPAQEATQPAPVPLTQTAPTPINLEPPSDPGPKAPAVTPGAAVVAETQLPAQASGAPVDTSVPAPSTAGAASLAGGAPVAAATPAPGAVLAAASSPSAAVEPTPPAQEATQPAPVPPVQAAQPPPDSDATGVKPAQTLDSNAVTVATARAPEAASQPPAATAAPIGQEPLSDPGQKPSAAVNPPAGDPDSVPLPPLGSRSDQPSDASPRTAQDSASPSADPGQAPATSSAPAPTPLQATSDDLPPLPPQSSAASVPSQADAKATAPAAQPVPPAGDTAPSTVALAPDDLPPLPQGGAGGADVKTKAAPLPPAAEDLPALPPTVADSPALPAGTAGNPPAGPETITKPDPVAQAAPTQPTAPDPAAPQTPAGASTTRPEIEPAAPASSPAPAAAAAVGAEAAIAVPDPTQAPDRIAAPAAADPLAPPRTRGAVMNPATAAIDSFLPQRENPTSTLRPDLQRQVEEIAQKQEQEDLLKQQTRPVPDNQPFAGPPDNITDLRTQTQTQVDISRAPSPAEARPIRAIAVPEDWVPLGRREWSPQRKYWAAAATCHMPLYFQDPMLERYGHSVEQYFGPLGRYMAYPVDDHTQTTQRMQMAQPWFSVGLFAWQIATWPYALVMDPPWEAQYDLGYWRPGDNIPTDLYYMPLHGTGPPLVGRNY